MSEQQNLSLSEAATKYLSTLSPEQKQDSQQELNKFVRWYGGGRRVTGLTALEIGNYCDGFDSSITDAESRLEPVKGFLSYAKKAKLIEISLASHVRAPKGKQKRLTRRAPPVATPVALTPEGYSTLEVELETLKAERPRIAEQLHLAAADKDFRENAPLEAARERQGQVEARIREIEAVLKTSTLVEEGPRTTHTVGVGSTVILSDLGTGEQSRYTLVSPSEANPAQGKLSIASPIGRAVMEQAVGAEVEVIAPAGKLQYRIDDIAS
jgi:transcription elongation factor GreA